MPSLSEHFQHGASSSQRAGSEGGTHHRRPGELKRAAAKAKREAAKSKAAAKRQKEKEKAEKKRKLAKDKAAKARAKLKAKIARERKAARKAAARGTVPAAEAVHVYTEDTWDDHADTATEAAELVSDDDEPWPDAVPRYVDLAPGHYAPPGRTATRDVVIRPTPADVPGFGPTDRINLADIQHGDARNARVLQFWSRHGDFDQPPTPPPQPVYPRGLTPANAAHGFFAAEASVTGPAIHPYEWQRFFAGNPSLGTFSVENSIKYLLREREALTGIPPPPWAEEVLDSWDLDVWEDALRGLPESAAIERVYRDQRWDFEARLGGRAQRYNVSSETGEPGTFEWTEDFTTVPKLSQRRVSDENPVDVQLMPGWLAELEFNGWRRQVVNGRILYVSPNFAGGVEIPETVMPAVRRLPSAVHLSRTTSPLTAMEYAQSKLIHSERAREQGLQMLARIMFNYEAAVAAAEEDGYAGRGAYTAMARYAGQKAGEAALERYGDDPSKIVSDAEAVRDAVTSEPVRGVVGHISNALGGLFGW